jgi:predicted regulator of amino acid metabolism with ACT domain
MQLRSILKNFMFIHFLALLSLITLWGFIETKNSYLLLGILASVLGAICGSFIRVVDAIKETRI